jgi:hypothetical protein
MGIFIIDYLLHDNFIWIDLVVQLESGMCGNDWC